VGAPPSSRQEGVQGREYGWDGPVPQPASPATPRSTHRPGL